MPFNLENFKRPVNYDGKETIKPTPVKNPSVHPAPKAIPNFSEKVFNDVPKEYADIVPLKSETVNKPGNQLSRVNQTQKDKGTSCSVLPQNMPIADSVITLNEKFYLKLTIFFLAAGMVCSYFLKRDL